VRTADASVLLTNVFRLRFSNFSPLSRWAVNFCFTNVHVGTLRDVTLEFQAATTTNQDWNAGLKSFDYTYNTVDFDDGYDDRIFELWPSTSQMLIQDQCDIKY
jgi:hypothetical protein